MIDINILHDLLAYSPETGELTWKPRSESMFSTPRASRTWNSRYAGKNAGAVKDGYFNVSIYKTLIKAHRIAWAMVYGEWPKSTLDHINGIRSDNRIENLRLATQQENLKNKRLLQSNKTGFHGISLTPHGKYRAKGLVNGRQIHLGYFNSVSDAAKVRKSFEVANGYHANHGV